MNLKHFLKFVKEFNNGTESKTEDPGEVFQTIIKDKGITEGWVTYCPGIMNFKNLIVPGDESKDDGKKTVTVYSVDFERTFDIEWIEVSTFQDVSHTSKDEVRDIDDCEGFCEGFAIMFKLKASPNVIVCCEQVVELKLTKNEYPLKYPRVVAGGHWDPVIFTKRGMIAGDGHRRLTKSEHKFTLSEIQTIVNGPVSESDTEEFEELDYRLYEIIDDVISDPLDTECATLLYSNVY